MTRAGGDALYAETARQSGNGEIHVEDCYFKDNNISHVRIDKGYVKDTVIHNTGNVPGNFEDKVNSRGLHQFYDGDATVTVENVHVDVTSSNTNGGSSAVNLNSPASQWDIRNSEIKGNRADEGNATYTNVGTNPEIKIPDGVPKKPE